MRGRDYRSLLRLTSQRRLAIPIRLLQALDLEACKVVRVLETMEVRLIATNISELARALHARRPPVRYVCGIDPEAAPEVVDCSSFVGYLYQQWGIMLPRLSIDQFQHGMPVCEEALQPCDLVFRTSHRNFVRNDVSIGHVGMVVQAAEEPVARGQLVAHATNGGLEIVSLREFIGSFTYRGARRLVYEDIFTIELPSGDRFDGVTDLQSMLERITREAVIVDA